MLVMFLTLIIGGFLLGFAAIFATIMIVTVVMGSYNVCARVQRTAYNLVVKLMHQIPTVRRLSSKAIEA